METISVKVLLSSDVSHFFTLDFPNPDYIGRSLKPNIDNLTEKIGQSCSFRQLREIGKLSKIAR